MAKMQSRMNQSHRPRRAQLRIVLLLLPSELNAPSQKSPEADGCRSASLHPVCQCARLARRRARRLLLLLRADSLYPSQHPQLYPENFPIFRPGCVSYHIPPDVTSVGQHPDEGF